MDRRILLGTALFFLLPLAGCSLPTEYTISVNEPTNGTVIENASAEFVDDWQGMEYEIDYKSEYRNNSSYSFKTYEHVNDSLELEENSPFTHIESSSTHTDQGTVYHGDVAPPWDRGEKRVYEIRVVDDTTGTIIDAVTITIENNGS